MDYAQIYLAFVKYFIEVNYELELNFKEQTLKFNKEEQETYLFYNNIINDWANIFKEMICTREEIKSLRD